MDLFTYSPFSFLNDTQILSGLKAELPHYLASAADVAEDVEVVDWWSRHSKPSDHTLSVLFSLYSRTPLQQKGCSRFSITHFLIVNLKTTLNLPSCYNIASTRLLYIRLYTVCVLNVYYSLVTLSICWPCMSIIAGKKTL